MFCLYWERVCVPYSQIRRLSKSNLEYNHSSIKKGDHDLVFCSSVFASVLVLWLLVELLLVLLWLLHHHCVWWWLTFLGTHGKRASIRAAPNENTKSIHGQEETTNSCQPERPAEMTHFNQIIIFGRFYPEINRPADC